MCASAGAPRSSDSSSAETRSGTSARLSGTVPVTAMSASSAMASGWPRPSRTSLRPGGRRHPGALEQLAALRLVEVVEAVHPDHRAPAGIAAPGRGGGLAAGQHDHAVGRQRGQERLAQPAVDGAELLVAVDQQDGAGEQRAQPRPVGAGRSRKAGRARPPRRPRTPPARDRPHGRRAAGRSGPRPAPGCGTPAAGWSCRCLPGRAPAGPAAAERPSRTSLEAGQLAPAAHEGPAPRVVQQVAETRRHRSPPSQHMAMRQGAPPARVPTDLLNTGYVSRRRCPPWSASSSTARTCAYHAGARLQPSVGLLTNCLVVTEVEVQEVARRDRVRSRLAAAGAGRRGPTGAGPVAGTGSPCG